jgi:hypothetical protein
MPHPGHLLKLCLTRTHLVRKKTNRIGSRPPSQTTYLEAVSVKVTVAISTERDQVFVYIIAAQPASRATVVDLGMTRFRMLCVEGET